MSYRTLDPMTEGPMQTGPTRDYKALGEAMPMWVEQPHAIRPQRLPVELALAAPRPKVHTPPITTLRPSRLPVLIRTSNVRPSEAGEGLAGSTWGVSDPGLYHRRDSMLAASDPTQQPAAAAAQQWSLASQVTTRLVLCGVAAGVALYFMRKNAKGG
jgi:hypothetical protein